MSDPAAGFSTPAWANLPDRAVRAMILAQHHPLLSDELVTKVKSLVDAAAELAFYDLEGDASLDGVSADFAIVLGGDGSMLRAGAK